MRDKVLNGEIDPSRVVEALLGKVPGEADVFYQKHMAHHMIDGVPRDWMGQVQNVYLIRNPSSVLASYIEKRDAVTLDDLGYHQMQHFFEAESEPVVIDAEDILADPARLLEALCGKLGIPFEDAMLSWPPGPQPTDGIWGAHWYERVWASTGFSRPADKPRLVSGRLDILEPALELYDAMRQVRIR